MKTNTISRKSVCFTFVCVDFGRLVLYYINILSKWKRCQIDV